MSAKFNGRYNTSRNASKTTRCDITSFSLSPTLILSPAMDAPRTRGERCRCPRHRADAPKVTAHGAQPLALGRIPDLHVPVLGANCDVLSLVRPRQRRHRVHAFGQVAQARHFARVGRPQVDSRAETDGEHILRRPINQIQVKVVGERGRIQHLERLLGDFARRLGRTAEQVTRLDAHWHVVERARLERRLEAQRARRVRRAHRRCKRACYCGRGGATTKTAATAAAAAATCRRRTDIGRSCRATSGRRRRRACIIVVIGNELRTNQHLVRGARLIIGARLNRGSTVAGRDTRCRRRWH